MDDNAFNKSLEIACEVSARAQKRATDDQEFELRGLIKSRRSDLRCVGCGNEVKWISWAADGEETEYGYYDGGGLLIDRMGYGSTLDMDLVAVLVCDACAQNHGLSTDWIKRMSEYFQEEIKKPREVDYEI